jgi:type I restriction enzyme S subunit
MSFQKYEAYKDSGVEWLGEVPEHWTLMPLKWLCELVTVKATETRWQIGLENVESWSGRFIESESEFAGSGLEFIANDILFGKLRPYLAKAYLAEKSGEAVGDFFVLRSHTILAKYLHKYILSPSVINILNASTIGAKMPRVSWEDMGSLPVVFPPKDEQTQIARFLDHETARIDSLIAEQERLIELLKEKRQAVISHAVTKGLDPTAPMKDSGVEWLGEVPEHWGVCRITHHLKSLVDYRGRTPQKDDNGVFLVTAKNIRNGLIDYEASQEYITEEAYQEVMQRGHPEVGDVVFTTEAPLGQVANLDRNDIALAQRVIKFCGENSVVDNYFLKYWIMGNVCQSELQSLATGSTALGIKGSKINQLSFCLPPFAEQQKIVDWLNKQNANLDKLVEQANRGIKLLQERRSALISAAVTGKIDVRGWQPPASVAPSPVVACG